MSVAGLRNRSVGSQSLGFGLGQSGPFCGVRYGRLGLVPGHPEFTPRALPTAPCCLERLGGIWASGENDALPPVGRVGLGVPIPGRMERQGDSRSVVTVH